jgi:hypothetical protein
VLVCAATNSSRLMEVKSGQTTSPVTRLIGTWRTIAIISLLVAMWRALLSSREQIHEHSIEAWPLTTMGEGSVVRMDDLQIGETWKPRECWIQGSLEAFRLALI